MNISTLWKLVAGAVLLGLALFAVLVMALFGWALMAVERPPVRDIESVPGWWE